MRNRLTAYLTSLPGLLSLLLLAGGCTNEECIENKTTLPYAAAYSHADPLQKVTLDSIYIYAEKGPEGNAVNDSTDSFSELYLPLDNEQDTTRFIFRYLQKSLAQYNLTDTLTVAYTRSPRFVSAACGVSYDYLILSARTSGFLLDSISLPEPMVTNRRMTNINLYFRVSEPEDPNTDNQ